VTGRTLSVKAIFRLGCRSPDPAIPEARHTAVADRGTASPEVEGARGRSADRPGATAHEGREPGAADPGRSDPRCRNADSGSRTTGRAGAEPERWVRPGGRGSRRAVRPDPGAGVDRVAVRGGPDHIPACGGSAGGRTPRARFAGVVSGPPGAPLADQRRACRPRSDTRGRRAGGAPRHPPPMATQSARPATLRISHWYGCPAGHRRL